MINIYKNYKEIVLYVIFGIFTTIVNIIVFRLCRENLNLEISIANTVAWFWSVFFAYMTNRKWVFNSKTTCVWKEIFHFYFARVATLLLETIILYLFIDMYNIDDICAKIISNTFVIISNYVFSKKFVFKYK